MRVDSVNAGRPEPMTIGGRTISTGIRKAPVGRGFAGPFGLAGDAVVDQEAHGGPDQALYLYSSADYAWWGGELGSTPGAGTFGENLTLSSFGPGEVRIGDRFRVGPALVEVDRAAHPVLDLRDPDGRAELGEALRRRPPPGSTSACSSPVRSPRATRSSASRARTVTPQSSS